jgi:hypothetical protein
VGGALGRHHYATCVEAERALLEYVRRDWDAEVGTDQPDDPHKMIDEYF